MVFKLNWIAYNIIRFKLATRNGKEVEVEVERKKAKGCNIRKCCHKQE